MRQREYQPVTGQIDEQRMEIENRIKNLCWTVSGDYSLNIKPDVEAFARSKYIALYDAIKQGAFGKYFDLKELSLYILKKAALSAKEKPLMELVQLCVDAAVYPLISEERLGIDDVRAKAFHDILEYQGNIMEQTYLGQVKKAILKGFIGQGDETIADDLEHVVRKINSLASAKNTADIIAVIDHIYNDLFDPTFEQKHGDLQTVLRSTQFDLTESFWQECMSDEQMEEIIKLYRSNLSDDMMRLDIDEHKTAYIPYHKDTKDAKADEDAADPEAIKKVAEYVQLNYGKSYLSALEQARIKGKLCRGLHGNCTLLFTEGILHAAVLKNNQYRFSQLQFEKNRTYYYSNHWIIKRNIAVLADTLQKAMVLRQEEEHCRFYSGQLVPARVWKVTRTDDIKLFDKKIKSDNSEFVVDILLDASGSQAKRQSQVAVQGYIISEALSQVGIAHRVVSYSTFWDYTVLQRFRDYDDDREANMRIFEFRASANNRDGLAIKAVCDALTQRQEDNKILIVLSDGKPNDMGTSRPGTRKILPYTGDDAVKDTAFEVRRARASGICVLGIFAGIEDDLPAEKKIYGKDFAYIRNISNFSRIVGTYLRRQMDKEDN